MTATPFELRRDPYWITADRDRLDIDSVHALLGTTHWAREMPRSVLEIAMANSLCFGLFENDDLIGFARLITDYCTYAYMTDVVVAEAKRGHGLGKWFMEVALNEHPQMKGLRRIALLTFDAQWLYEPLGFVANSGGRFTYMERVPTTAY